MGHFAEIDGDNKVIRVVIISDNDIQSNGGDLSESAAKAVEKIIPFSKEGVRWIQTSYNNNFRKQYAGIDDTFNPVKNIFIKPAPFASWSLNDNGDWNPPIPRPSTSYDENGVLLLYISWDEPKQRWVNYTREWYLKKTNDPTNFNPEEDILIWNPETSVWVKS